MGIAGRVTVNKARECVDLICVRCYDSESFTLGRGLHGTVCLNRCEKDDCRRVFCL